MNSNNSFSSANVGEIGVKAYHLAQLKKHRIPIPETVFLPVAWYYEFVETNQILSLTDELKERFRRGRPVTELHPLLKTVRNSIVHGKFTPERENQLLAICSQFNGAFAVRSSALSEDSASYSFAGQYDTILSVQPEAQALARAVKQVWSSQWRDSVAEYVLNNRDVSFTDGMGVIIQRMVEAQISGVLFTRRPDSLNDEHIFIEYVRGTGEKLVSGEATPEHVEVLKNKPLSEQAEKLPFAFRKPLSELIRDALKIEILYGGAVDIEWAVENNTVYFLQYRPLTTGAEEILWTNENVGEVIPDVVTPYSWSILKPVTNNAFASLLHILKIKDYPSGGLFEVYKGRVYFNNTLFNRLLSDFYLTERLQNAHFFVLVNIVFRKLPVMMHAGLFLLLLPYRITRYLKTLPASLNRKSYTEKKDSAFHLKKTDEIIRQHQQTMNLHLSCTVFAELYYQLLSKICSGKETAAGPVSVDALLSGAKGAESARSGRILWQIAEKIASNATLQKIVLETDVSNLEQALTAHRDGAEVWQEIQRFLDEFGHGALHEFELYYPRWQEDAHYILSNLKTYVRSRSALEGEAGQERKTLKQKKLYSNAQKSFSLIGRLFFRFIYSKAVFYGVQRENLKQAFLKFHFQLKKHLSALARDLELEDVRSLLFLTHGELMQALEGALPRSQILERINKRQEERQTWLHYHHPARVRQLGDQWIPLSEEEHSASGNVLKGIACSAGVVEGRARIILHPEDSAGIEHGDVLIARAVNPGWTPLFVSAAGIVSEIGGALSHGAIIAREYSLPMVAAVPGIMSKVTEGQRIRINGFEGTVELLEEKS